MFHGNSIITSCLAFVVLLTSTAALAVIDNPSSHKLSSLESAKKQTSAQINIVANAGNDIVDETRLRSGPGDPVSGKSKAELCFGCHGEDGNSADPLIPKLAGQFGIYIAKQLRDYQDNLRNHQMMSPIAVVVKDEDMADIAAFFASQPVMKGDRPFRNRTGKKLFENDDMSRMMVRCNNCHGATGKGQNSGNPVSPVIGGQHKEYLLSQLLRFKKGELNNSQGGVMNIIVQRLSDNELEALAEYISGL
jgi:cytochrome c553